MMRYANSYINAECEDRKTRDAKIAIVSKKQYKKYHVGHLLATQMLALK